MGTIEEKHSQHDASTGDANNINAQMINSFFMGNALDGDYDKTIQKLHGMGFPEYNVKWAARTLALDRNQSTKIPDALFRFGNQMTEAYDNSTKELISGCWRLPTLLLTSEPGQQPAIR